MAAMTSMAYAVATASRHAQDLRVFQLGAREWLDGTYKMGAGPIFLHPPFAVPLLAPLALVSFDKLVLIWLLLNIAATIVTIYAVIKLYGSGWGATPRFYLAAFLLTWAPFRVTLRAGQMSLMITALLLGSLLARQSKRQILSGILLALSLSKYSLTYPFLLYLIWKREWKILGTAALTLALLTQIFLWWLQMPALTMLKEYFHAVGSQMAGGSGFTGTTEIKVLLFGLTGNESVTFVSTIVLCVVALVAMAVVFKRTVRCENIHFAILSLFALWSSYHRTYDSVICILPAALLIDFVVRGKLRKFSWIGLGALGLLVLSIPGFLTERLHLDHSQLTTNALGFLGLHVERIMVFTFFCALLVLLWKADRPVLNDICEAA